MRLKLELVSKRHDCPQDVPRGTTRAQPASRDAGNAAWALIEDAWVKATEPGIDSEERRCRHNWLGGALVAYALFTGDSATDLRNRLEKSHSPPSATLDTSILSRMPTFQEGRSTPPPPRHPGAQTPVE